MCAATLLLLAALPALAGRPRWCAGGEVVTVLEGVAGGAGSAGDAAGPTFEPAQRTAVVAPAGHAATLDCRVLRLHDKSVSWVRSRDLQILSHAGAVFTADARVSAASSGGERGPGGAASSHTLRIERLRVEDGGRYECQVNTEPKMSLFFNLTVVEEPVPEVVVWALGGARGEAGRVTGVRGEAATLACAARYQPPPRRLPLPPLDIVWRKADLPISLQSGRGMALDTQRWAARVESRLTLAALAAADAGAYTCAAAGRAATITLQVYGDDERAEAMQRDEATSAAHAGSPHAAFLWAALLALMACR